MAPREKPKHDPVAIGWCVLTVIIVAMVFAGCGATLGVAIDPATGEPTVVLWWSPQTGEWSTHDRGGCIPYEVPLSPPPAAAPTEADDGDVQAAGSAYQRLGSLGVRGVRGSGCIRRAPGSTVTSRQRDAAASHDAGPASRAAAILGGAEPE